MKRVPEPELMTEHEQVEAYGKADFEEPHSNFIALLSEYCREAGDFKNVLDLGSGTGDIVLRFAKQYPNAQMDCVEDADEMIGFADALLGNYPSVRERVNFIHSMLQDFSSAKDYDLIMSNSLLHHLHNADDFWNKIKEHSGPGTSVFIMDLMRPDSTRRAKELLDEHTRGEPEVLKKDFFNSLLAAYEIEEIDEHLAKAGLTHLSIKRVSDRHFIVYGKLK